MDILGFPEAQLVAPLKDQTSSSLRLEEEAVARHTDEERNPASDPTLLAYTLENELDPSG